VIDAQTRGWTRAAQQLGISLEAYREHRDAGLRWCCAHQAWERADLFRERPNGQMESYCRPPEPASDGAS